MKCMRTRQSSYKIVGDCSDKAGHRYQLYSARGIGSQACDVYVTCDDVRCLNGFGIELVLCNFKLYLTRFFLSTGLFFDTFFIVMFY